MIQVAPNRSQKGLIAWAVLGVVLVIVLAAYKPLPAEPVATTGPSDVAAAPSTSSGPSPTSDATAKPTQRPIPTATPQPSQGRCVLPESLPTGATSGAIPKVEGRAGSILFGSPVYKPTRPNVSAQDYPGDYNMGVWFVPAPGAAPDLVVAAGTGMVIPLALSPNGREAAVWWWPERRRPSEVRCQQGIYTIDLTAGSTSRLIVQGDWSLPTEGMDIPDSMWDDPRPGSVPLRFLPPQAAFSSDGSLLALINGDRIDVYRTEFPADVVHHVGSCPQWGWAPNENRFVAACEGMTSAWLVYLQCCDAGMATTNIPIPKPTIDTFPAGWENTTYRAIGFDADGDIRIVRTYGFATGCEGEGGECNIPNPAWAVTTIDRDTQVATHGGAEFNVLFDSGTRMSADSSWFFGELGTDPPPALTLDLATGATVRVGGLGTAAGASIDGSTIYGWRYNSTGVAVRAATRTSTKALVVIASPDGALSYSGTILILGLYVGAAT